MEWARSWLTSWGDCVLKFQEFRKTEKGQAIVEMALILPILIMILFGIVEFGRVLNTYIVMTNLSREAARAGAIGSADTSINDLVKNSAADSGFDSTQVSVTISPTSLSKRARGTSVKVTVSYPVDIIAPVIGEIIGDPYIVESQTTMRVEG